MFNIDDQDVALENNEEATEEEAEEATPEPSAREKELEAELAKYKRIAERNAKKAERPKDEDPAPKQSSDLDYGQKAYLNSFGIKGSEELALVKDYMRRTGDPLDTIVEDDIFQAKLGKLREAKAAADAVPKSTKRSSQAATDDVSYWRQKIETGQAQLTDIPDVSLRRKVLNSRVEQERTGGMFSSNPVQFG